MIEIINVREMTEDASHLKIEFSDGNLKNHPNNGGRYRFTDQLNYWLEGKTLQWIEDDLAYKAYKSIMDYEACHANGDLNMDCGSPPAGWYFQEESDDSKETDNIKLTPTELPIVQPPNPLEEDLIPNEIEKYNPYYGWTLEQFQQHKINELKQARVEICNGVTELTSHLGNKYPVDLNQSNRSNMHQSYDNIVNAGIPLETATLWKMGDNKYYTITFSELASLGGAMGLFINEQFVHEANRLQEIQQCGEDTECILNISW